MNNIVGIIERLSTQISEEDVQLELAKILETEELSEPVRIALERGDMAGLQGLLDARTKIVCMLFPAKDDEEEQKENEDGDDSKEDKEESNLRVA